jgi:NAD(P)-dependent dehydrogenase (short-subunit alcohol dehydrogenase family)
MRVLITGGGSGLGAEIAKMLLQLPIEEHSQDEEVSVFLLDKYFIQLHTHATYEHRVSCDITSSKEIKDAVEQLSYFSPLPYDVLINCAGINEINFIEDLEESEWDRVMDTNAKGIYLVTKAFLSQLKGGTILNIVSNASHMPMTSSLAYNASKGAAHIMTLQMARELGPKHGITVFGISPNKLAGTGMSNYIDQRVVETRGWTPEYAKEYQLRALPAGEETPPWVLAEFISFLLSSKERHKYLAGTIIPYGK